MISRRKFVGLSIGALPCPFLLPKQVVSAPAKHLLAKPSAKARGRFQSAAAKTSEIDPDIKNVVDRVSIDRIKNTISELTSFQTRHTYSEAISEVEDWFVDRFHRIGYLGDSVSKQVFEIPSVTGSGKLKRHNVLCQSGNLSRRTLMICAHFDSISEVISQAPGADDNASGVSAMIEVATVLQPLNLSYDLIFAAFSGEEQGLWGAKACAETASSQKWPLECVVNLDMVGFVQPEKPSTVIIEFDQGNKSAANDSKSRSMAFRLAQTALDYGGLKTEHTDIWNSDYMPFEELGYPCVGFYDNASDELFYHSKIDVIENINFKRISDICKTIIAAILKI